MPIRNGGENAPNQIKELVALWALRMTFMVHLYDVIATFTALEPERLVVCRKEVAGLKGNGFRGLVLGVYPRSIACNEVFQCIAYFG